jgi:phosphoglycerate kinase
MAIKIIIIIIIIITIMMTCVHLICIQGVFEFDAFSKGTFAIASTMADLTATGCITIIGGGGMYMYAYILYMYTGCIYPYILIYISLDVYKHVHTLHDTLDSVAAVEKAGLGDKMDHISTGMYMLEQGRACPGYSGYGCPL